MEVRKGTIKKPKFIPTYVVSVVIMLVVLFVLAFLLLLPEVALYSTEAQSWGSEYENDLENCFFNIMDKEEITAEDLNKVKADAVVFYAETGSKCKIKIDGYGEFDSSKTAMLDYSYWTDNNDMDTHRTVSLMLADNKYLEYFFTPEVMEYYVPAYNGEEYYPKGLELQFSCTEFYADLEKGLFIPVEVDICKDTGYTNFLPTGIKIHIEPDNTEGYTHGFEDITDNYSWVNAELGWPSSVGIINGVSSTKFNPDGALTTEQAILITYRALGVLKAQ